ncbi:hypothetical protein LX15_000903 [Streptoalloteichus tenebrarius]|uniref:Uncharacterized protein n=1 Tax=Streptoalloteichus tenebrarius (strain ATCC 17920 / DSM 40477 / JCM 4838 / CBS 697.72 / NBRC 16177 / NCIMB 11028 / NRRL B-12390 / A12253. 1 / ISP 5477) TaxID=1933 RepID=A0ABT1HNZ3_STRSD|nr:hypothetical protein [Streptoalloteichus tenebrarius]MCP2257218.1 hypothetical protein [Streptoalloteichus tenebrarius]
MARAGVVLGGYFAAVHRFVDQLGATAEVGRLCPLAHAVLGGDARALLAFLHAVRRCLVSYQAPGEMWEWHEAALSVVIDLVVEGETFQRLDEEIHQGLVDTYQATWECD